MQHPFEALAPEYDALLARTVITRGGEVEAVANKLLRFVDQGRYAPVSAGTGVPQVWMATSFEREASSNFADSPAQGDRWDRRSVHVPAGRGPFSDWKSAAIDAYRIDGLQLVGTPNWTWARFCYEGEVFNGMGYRAHGIHSPYLWAGTNNYSSGKYVADGVWSSSAVDQQLGIVPVAVRMVALRPSLALPSRLPPAATPTPPIPTPQPAPQGVGQHGEHDTIWLQHSLNVLKVDGTPLQEDGSYGRRTRYAVIAFQSAHGLTADGIAGPLTAAAIEKELPSAG
jgi:lysozyme family protein